MAWSSRTVVRDGVRLHCRDWGGSGPAVVLLHGLAGQAGEWDTAAGWLSRRHRAIAVDGRGHGASDRRPADLSRAAHVADVIAVIDQLRLGPVVLIGQSLGGHTAMLTAAAHPEQVRALVLVEAGPGGPDPEGPSRIGEWLDSWPVPFATRQAAVDFFGGGPAGQGWAAGLRQREDGWWPRFDRDVMVESLRENSARSFWPDWDAVRCPTLVLLAQTGFISAEEAEEMLRRRPATVAASVPGSGHDLHLERPDALRGALESFLGTLL